MADTKPYVSIDELPAMMSVDDLQAFFCMGRRQAYELVHREGFPMLKIGQVIRIPKHLLLKWIEDNTGKGAT